MQYLLLHWLELLMKLEIQKILLIFLHVEIIVKNGNITASIKEFCNFPQEMKI